MTERSIPSASGPDSTSPTTSDAASGVRKARLCPQRRENLGNSECPLSSAKRTVTYPSSMPIAAAEKRFRSARMSFWPYAFVARTE